MPDFSGFFKTQIEWLDSVEPEFQRVYSINGIPGNDRQDSIDWKTELKIFETLNLNKPGLGGKYESTIDSSGKIAIQSWFAADSSTTVRRLSVTKVKNKTELIEAHIVNRGFVVDRDLLVSFQPFKGYTIRVFENYIWSKPSGYEINTQFQGLTGFE